MTLETVALSVANKLGRVNAAADTITDLSAEIYTEIGNAISFYNRKPWHLTEFAACDITTVSGTKWYSTFDMTSNADAGGDQDNTGRTAVNVNSLLDIEYMRETNSGLNDGMVETSYKGFERLQEGTSGSGTPERYCLYAGRIGIWPTPGAVYTIYFSGNIKPVIPTLTAHTSVWFDEALEMVEAGACKRVCLNYLRDAKRAQEYAVIEQGEMRAFHSEYITKTSRGKLRKHW